MVHISKSLAVAALIAAPAFAAPLQSSEGASTRDYTEVELERRAGAVAALGKVGSMLGGLGNLSSGLTIGATLIPLFKKKKEEPKKRDLSEEELLAARGIISFFKSPLFRNSIVPSAGIATGIGLGVGAGIKANSRRSLDEFESGLEMRDLAAIVDDIIAARDFLDYDVSSYEARDFEDEMFEAREFIDDLLEEREWDEMMDVFEREFVDVDELD